MPKKSIHGKDALQLCPVSLEFILSEVEISRKKKNYKEVFK